MEIEKLLSLHYCDCGRSYCQFFSPGEEEYGVSYSVEEIEEMLLNLPKIQKHLKQELKKAEAENE